MARYISLLLVLCTGLHSVSALANEPYPLDYFALREVVMDARVSPDGKRLAVLTIPSKDGDPVVEVYKTDNMSAKPFRINADPMEVRNIYWATNEDIVMRLRQKVRDKIEGFNQGVFEFKLASVNVKSKKFKEYEQIGASIVHLLPQKSRKVIYSFIPGEFENNRLSEPFRPTAYYELDLKTGRKRLILRGKIALGQVEFDNNGTPWLARGFDLKKGFYVWYYRRPGESDWTELYRLSEHSYESFDVVGFDINNPHLFFVVANNGHDKTGLWEFDSNKKAFTELIYRRNDVDVQGVRFHSNDWTSGDEVVAVRYATDKMHYEYFNAQEAAVYQQLESLVPHAYSVRVLSRTKDNQSLVVFNTGPRDPGSFYLLHKGKFSKVGSEQPLLEAEKLADVKYIKFKARDGRDLAAYVTVPNGKPPFPAIVLPHGGPFVDELVVYDEWAQMLANNGYMVVQPQYRGSFNYGIDFHKSAFIDGSEAGFKMQDDKDDAALELVKRGWAEKDRLAMYGWSYGGYAALVAASRTPQIYQCSIAGAAVADMTMQVNYYRAQLRGVQKERQLKYRLGAVNPIDETKKVNIPLLMIHGDVDQRVPVTHAVKYRKEIDDQGKPFKYVELKGADHFYDTLEYEHQKLLYESIIGFLKSDCGPGGL
ncbi:alpha/beta hydrolase family protein [Pseudoteredinibacter isoporae]|uniref:Dipeptidyl aminopeptidase/acylaminoacyl peptidase n=1 Tax=Pseudoteredinibacter isoporae TaxID=570281 RepID=A0A7X0JXK5_9GAMM|nr:prolyl oligopeptidase family serine peptidase [Pseudoteredinibacter isoporae]MBB6523538.1 dipeptidyl aminopeptidase/acylaminoacyl peptidase [Pseudoteredinibacter isoporae]NHO89047.1 S9 family peptidase [Pseudoteredinibacter isoporae]NIB22342.1 S9 family peptidase [Pseudoteredinibacter isoporae]